MAPRPLCALSLGGGGVRVFSSMYILKTIMEKVSVRGDHRPCEYFDIVGGTGTGG